MKKISLILIVMALPMLLFLSACGSDDSQESTTETSTASKAPDRDRTTRRVARNTPPPIVNPNEDPAKKIPKITAQGEQEGYGLTLIVDGSSPEAFAESLALIASDTSEQQYRQLDSAVRYLQVYSSDGWAGLPGFYERLNGMTGEEIIARANRLKEERGR